LTLGAEATFAAEGVEWLLRYDPMSMRPFMSYPEGAYAAHWLKVIGSAASQPIFAHVNRFQRDRKDGQYLWPGYADNLRPLLWLLRLKEGEVRGRQTPVGIIPATAELDRDGVATTPEDLRRSSRSTRRGGSRRWSTASSTWSSSPACPRRSGRRTAASPQPSTTRTERRGAPAHGGAGPARLASGGSRPAHDGALSSGCVSAPFGGTRHRRSPHSPRRGVRDRGCATSCW
jgi:Phosphoenolpyruvate carboxykinase C-terminal P-loop domain